MKEPFRRKVRKPQRHIDWDLRTFNPRLYHVYVCPLGIFAAIGFSILYSFKNPIITITTEVHKITNNEKTWTELIGEALVSTFVLWLLLKFAVWVGNAITRCCQRRRRNKMKR